MSRRFRVGGVVEPSESRCSALGPVAVASTLGLLALAGCPEYRAEDTAEFNVSFNALIQYGDWSDEVYDCRLEVAFLGPGEGDGTRASEGAVVDLPEDPGTCEVTYFDRDSERAQSSLSVFGTLEAGDEVMLGFADENLELLRGEGEEGMLHYSLPECDQTRFPFAQSLDLIVSGSDTADSVPGFSLERALGIGADLVLLEPAISDEDDATVNQYVDESLELTWEHQGPSLVLGEITLEPSPMIFLRNQEPDLFLFEAVACRPDHSDRFVIPAEVLGQLTPQPSGDPDYYTTSLQLDVTYEAGDAPTLWGSVVRRHSRISGGGRVRLLERP